MARQSTLARFEVSGEILGEDVVGQLTATECRLPGGQRAEDRLMIEWDILSEEWQVYRHHVSTYGKAKLRRRWIHPFLTSLGYTWEELNEEIIFGDSQRIPITHRTGGGVPIWVLEYGQSPDERTVTGRRARSPHEIFQEYLDQDDAVNWGILCNGKTIRLLHDYHKTLTRNYVEADLESIFDSLDVDAFRAVWRIFHADSFRSNDKGIRPIEQIRDYSRQEGAEVGKELRFQVVEALKILANGFLAANTGGELLAALREDTLNAPMAFYQALLRIVYRLLFLFYIENKPGWTPSANPIWASSYSISRLREQAEAETSSLRSAGEDHWEGLKVVFDMIRKGYEPFGIHPYGGELFDDANLWGLAVFPLRNSDLLAAIRCLTMFERNKQPYRVNFRTLRIEALGSVYEALLDIAPTVTDDGRFGFGEGTERKLSGSYYTPPSLVNELIQSALLPVIEGKLADVGMQATINEKEVALLSIRVVDPACGSGHFLLAATDAIAAYLCKIRKGGEEPSDLDVREARRDVVEKCIFGVDINPMSVELCTFILWLHVAHPRFMLSYLKPHILCGNALVGVPLLRQAEAVVAQVEAERQRLLDAGESKKAARIRYIGFPSAVPSEAYEPVAGDDRNAAQRIKKVNETFVQTGQGNLEVYGAFRDASESHREILRRVGASKLPVLMANDRELDERERKDVAWKSHRTSKDYDEAKRLYDLWCAAFYWRIDKNAGGADVPTSEFLRRVGKDGVPKERLPKTVAAELDRIVEIVNPFHWELEFPEVFEAGGFDCVLGNPPWERIKLQEQEFFASRSPEIAKAKNKSERGAMIAMLRTETPALWEAFQTAKHAAEAESKFIRKAGRFPLTAVGDVNTYALFAEHFRTLLAPTGRAGVIVQSGIATDDTNKNFFADLVARKSLISLFDFVNLEGFFPGIHKTHPHFCALTISGKESNNIVQFAFYMTRPSQLAEQIRRLSLSTTEIALLNPNTRTCPVFRTRADAELTRTIYKRVPVLWQEDGDRNPWGIRFMAMVHMSNDSGLFAPLHVDPVPLYEAKMLHQFDHRFATYERGARTGGDDDETRPVTEEEKRDPLYAPNPRYFVERAEVWKKVARVPELLVEKTLAGNVADVNKILQMWLAGYCLNRGDAGDTNRAQIGEQIVQKMSMTTFGSAFGDAMAYWTNQAGCRALEQRFPLDAHDMEIVAAHAQDALNRGTETVDTLALSRALLARKCPRWLIGFRDITNATNERTSIFSPIPLCGVGNSAPILFIEVALQDLACCLLGDMNCIAHDFLVRPKIGGMHMNFFLVKQLPVLPPVAYSDADIAYITPRVLELVYTAHDMKPFAEDMGYHGEPFVWDNDRRATLRAELDAYYARLYGLTRKQLRYILDPHGLSDAELTNILDPTEDPTCAGPHLLPTVPTTTFPGETFRVLKNNDNTKYGDYRTRRLVLEAWARLEEELGPAPICDYRELIQASPASEGKVNITLMRPLTANTKAKASVPIVKKQTEPENLILVHPDTTPHATPLDLSQPEVPVLADHVATARPKVPSVGSRVQVNGRSGLLQSAQIDGEKIKIHILLDGDTIAKSFYAPPIIVVEEEMDSGGQK